MKKLRLGKLPNPFEDKVDVEKLAEEYLQKWRGLNNVHLSNIIHADRCKNDFIAGYKAAQQSNKQFSLEDIKKAIEMAREGNFSNYEHYGYVDWVNSEEQIIQSLSTQQLPVGFIPEPNDIGFIKNADIMVGKKLYDKIMSPFKTITNSDGKEELVGNYVY